MFIRADCKNVLLSIGRSFYYKWNYTYGMDRGETRKGLWVFRKTKAVCTPRWVRWIGSFYQVIKFWMKNIIEEKNFCIIFENDNLFMFIAFRCYDTNEAKGSCIFQFRVIFSWAIAISSSYFYHDVWLYVMFF